MSEHQAAQDITKRELRQRLVHSAERSSRLTGPLASRGQGERQPRDCAPPDKRLGISFDRSRHTFSLAGHER